MAYAPANWWNQQNKSTAAQNAANTAKANQVDQYAMSQLGIGGAGGQQPSWSDGLDTYSQPPSQAIQNLVYKLSHSGSGNSVNPFNVTKYGGPEGGYVYSDTLSPYTGSALGNQEQRNIWINDQGQQFNMVDGKVPDIAKIGQNSQQFVGSNTVGGATGANAYNANINATKGGTQIPNVGQQSGMMGGMAGTQTSALTNLDQMLANPLFKQTQDSLSGSLQQGPITDQLREALRTSSAERNASLRDQQLKDIQNKAGAAGVGRQDMSNSAVAGLQGALAQSQAGADREAAMMQATTNQAAKESAQGKSTDFLNLLRQWQKDQQDNNNAQSIAYMNNLWNWLGQNSLSE